MKTLIKVTQKIMAYIIGLIIITLVGIMVWLKIVSPGTTKPFTNLNGEIIDNSIAEVAYLEINGIKQFVLIRGENINNPVLLMLHGGPGSPQAHLNCKYNSELEKHYVVVNWDQRGAGASYYDSISSQNLSIDILINDTKTLTNYLRERFNQDKIFILGHSWGSYLGMRTIKKYPELYYAYIGIGQVSNQQKSEEMSYDFVYNKAKETNNTNAIKQLEKIGRPKNGVYRNPSKSMMVERKWVSNFGGAAVGFTQKDFMRIFIMPMLTFKEYRTKDKFNYVKGMNKTQKIIWETLMNEQLNDIVKEVKVPVYILQGVNDYQTVYSLAKSYFDSLSAPKKEFISFTNSAHMLPYNKEIDKFHDILINKIPSEIIKK